MRLRSTAQLRQPAQLEQQLADAPVNPIRDELIPVRAAKAAAESPLEGARHAREIAACARARVAGTA